MDQVNFESTYALAWPWTTALKNKLRQLRAKPFTGSHLLFGSDYSGDHRGSRFQVYGFVIVDADSSPEWPARCETVRRSFLTDGRRMSFKNLNDRHRRRALIPFLKAAESLNGHVVAVAVSKDLKRLSTSNNSLSQWKNLHGLQAKWDERWFEQMVRVTHFFSLFLSEWSTPGMHISWITDNDNIVANNARLDDMHEFAARFSSIFIPHQLGEFMMNTASVDSENRNFEDFLAIPDLAAGMLSEALSSMSIKDYTNNQQIKPKELTEKSEIISDWFWHQKGSLKKTCILIDRVDNDDIGVGELHMLRTY